ncbi:hypothetical protein D8770_25175 [Methylobacterium sp. DB1607]|nr:hypothetical protein [Methylobacterium sp. DB1607]
MVDRIDDTLRAKGYAQVLVAVQLDAGAGARDVRDFESHFVVPNQPQAAALVAAAERASAAGRPRPREPQVRLFPRLGLAIGYVDAQGADALSRDARVSSFDVAPAIGLIRPVRTDLRTPRARVSWGLRRLGVPKLWERGLTGRGVLVGHLDTGVDATHPAFAGALDECPSSDDLGHSAVFRSGGSGPSGVRG